MRPSPAKVRAPTFGLRPFTKLPPPRHVWCCPGTLHTLLIAVMRCESSPWQPPGVRCRGPGHGETRGEVERAWCRVVQWTLRALGGIAPWAALRLGSAAIGADTCFGRVRPSSGRARFALGSSNHSLVESWCPPNLGRCDQILALWFAQAWLGFDQIRAWLARFRD